MRPIKFRAWHIPSKTMLYNFPYHRDESKKVWWVDYISGYPFHEIKEVMQFTGLFDKSGKEIWEGDILGFPGNPNFKQVVEWNHQEWDEDGFHTGFHFDLTGDQYEVLGNIYESSHLLGDKNVS